jgi:hypothetical protein
MALAAGTAGMIGGVMLTPSGLGDSAVAQSTPALPEPPADGTLGFVVETFVPPVLQGADACPQGTALKLKDAYLATLPEAERDRLSRKENEPEFTKRWQATAHGPNNTNICSQPDRFQRPTIRTVQSSRAEGLDVSSEAGEDTCGHDEFTSPAGETGIDNQEYRVMGCTLEWRGKDGIAGDLSSGLRQFHASGEWTQVILLRGVDSFDRDDDVEIVYANTADRPPADTKGRFLRGASFSVSDRAPRYRNVLHGRINKGVLTSDAADILLTQTWGQGGARDIRGNRSRYEFRHARLRLVFNPDGSLQGLLGGYRPAFDVIQSPSIGGLGAATTAGIDCAAMLGTLLKFADGLRDRKTGKCTGVSSAMRIVAIPAFVTDVAPAARGELR